MDRFGKGIFIAGLFLLGLAVPHYAVSGDLLPGIEATRKAAEQGDAPAQFNLGWMYHKGIGVARDNKEAVRWYRQAAEQGDAPAQNNLGAMYGLGRSVLKDPVLAHMWCNIAAANGYKKAGERRDSLAKTMTPQQIAEAQARARVCVEQGYKGC